MKLGPLLAIGGIALVVYHFAVPIIAATANQTQPSASPNPSATPVMPVVTSTGTQVIPNSQVPKADVLASRMIAAIGMDTANADQWNWAYQQIQGGAEQPKPENFLPSSIDRNATFSATDYIRMRGLTGLRRIA